MAVLNSACAAALQSTRNSTVPRRGIACWCALCVCADTGEANELAAVMPSSTESAPLMVAPFGYVHRSANRMSLSDGRGKLGWVRRYRPGGTGCLGDSVGAYGVTGGQPESQRAPLRPDRRPPGSTPSSRRFTLLHNAELAEQRRRGDLVPVNKTRTGATSCKSPPTRRRPSSMARRPRLSSWGCR